MGAGEAPLGAWPLAALCTRASTLLGTVTPTSGCIEHHRAVLDPPAPLSLTTTYPAPQANERRVRVWNPRMCVRKTAQINVSFSKYMAHAPALNLTTSL